MKLLLLVAVACSLTARFALADEVFAERIENERSIPLSSIFTTGPQEGMLHRKDVFPRNEGERDYAVRTAYLQQIEGTAKCGASNVFLVEAEKVEDAIRATTTVVLGSRTARTPAQVNVPKPNTGSYWLVAYLGAGPSQPTWWTVTSAAISGHTVTVTYGESAPAPVTRDVRPYYYWIPLSALGKGCYNLKLYDSNREMVTLTRKVEINPSN